MTTAAVVLAAVLAVAAVLWVARPLLSRDDRNGEPEASDAAAAERLRLLEERDRALAALKELEFDHRTGKISDTDYVELVRPLRADAAAALAALDDVTGAGEAAAPEPGAPVETVVAEPVPNGNAAERQERPAVLRQEECGLRGAVAVDELRPGLVEVLAQPPAGDLSERHHAILGVLPFVDPHETAVEIEVVEAERAQLRVADPRRVQDLEHRAIPQARTVQRDWDPSRRERTVPTAHAAHRSRDG